MFAALAVLVAGLVLTLNYLGYELPPKPQTMNADQIREENLTIKGESLRVYHADSPQKGLVIYIADKSQEQATAAYAKKIAALSYYVAIIDNETLLNLPTQAENHCLDLAQKLGEFNAQLQQHFQLDKDTRPILFGIEQSAASVYAALAQTSEHKFHAAVSINFSDKLKAHTPLCDGEQFLHPDNELLLAPIKRLPTSFYIFQDNNYFPAVASFTDKTANIKLTTTSDKKQNTLEEAIQILQWLDPRLGDQISSDASDSDLPLIEVPVAEVTTNPPNNSESLAVLVTGDGGWAEIDKSLANILAEKGIPTLALDSLSYFWKARTPEQTAQDIEESISIYLQKWNKKRVILIGYSFGADVLPFVANRLTSETQQKISLIALLGMGKTAAFEFRLSSWMNADTNASRLPILPEIEKMQWAKSICVYGEKDDAANCLPTVKFGVNAIKMPGDHHFDERYEDLVEHILRNEKH